MRKVWIRGALGLLFFSMLGVLLIESEKKGVFQVHAIQLTLGMPQNEWPETETQIRKVELRPSQKYQPHQFADVLVEKLRTDLLPLDGMSLWQIPMGLLSERLSQNSWIEQFEVSRRAPNEIWIHITVKEPVAIFLSSTGHAIPFANDGTLLPESSSQLAPDLPVTRDARLMKEPATRGRLARLMNQIPASGVLSRSTISEVRLDRDKQFWLVIEGSEALVKLGEEQVPIRIARVNQVIEYLNRNNFKGRVIDADFSKKVLVRLRNRN